MCENIYYVQPGDTLAEIAKRLDTSVEDILKANVICNPNLIFIGQLLIIPRPGLELPKAGGGPYYVLLPGDTLYCLANEFNTSIQVLAEANQILNPNILLSGSELLIAQDIPDPQQIKKSWEETAEQFCDQLSSLQIHGIYYIGSFQWAALGRKAIPYLLELLENPCETVRYYAVVSLGRIAMNKTVKQALTSILDDKPAVSQIAKLALERIELAAKGFKRIHLTTSDTYLAEQPFLDAPAQELPAGTQVIVTRWNIPSPTGEGLPPGGLAVWDQVQVLPSGKTGFLLRVGYNEIELI